MQTLAQQAYGHVQHRTAGEKELEFALFGQITEDLKNVQENENPAPTLWADAISRNLQLWTLLASDLLNPGNAMPDELKQGLLSLSEFVRQTSMRALGGSCDLSDLIDVNLTVMQGLANNANNVAIGNSV